MLLKVILLNRLCSLEDPQKWSEEYHMRSISETVKTIVNDCEMPVWRSHSGKRLDSADVRLRRRFEACGAQYPKSGVSGGDGRRGAALAQVWMFMNFVPRPMQPQHL